MNVSRELGNLSGYVDHLNERIIITIKKNETIFENFSSDSCDGPSPEFVLDLKILFNDVWFEFKESAWI